MHRAVEGDEHTVAGRIHLTAVELLELRTRHLEMEGDGVIPRNVAEPRRDRCRIDDVGDQQRRQMTTGHPGPEARECSNTCPLDDRARLIAEREAVVTGRNVVYIAGMELGSCSVRQHEDEFVGDDRADVASLTPFAADQRLHVLRPPPTRFCRRTRNHDVAEDHCILHDTRKSVDLVRVVETLRQMLPHRIMMR